MEAFVGLRELLRRAKGTKTFAEVAEEAKLPGKAAGQAVSDALNRNDGISYVLADYVLRQTICTKDPMERAIAALSEAGIPAEDLPSLRKMLDPMRKVQTSAELIVDRDVIAPKTLAAITVREPEEKYGVKPVGPRQPVNLRHQLKVFHRTTPDDPKRIPVPKWLNMAAGDGSDLELCEDYIYFRELPDWKGVHSAVVRGDSMLETLEPGDVIVMKEFDGGTWELPQIESPDEKSPLVEFKRRTKLGDNDICVLSINDDPPTLKRVVFDTSRGTDWKLQIIADNPPAWRTTFQVALGDKVVFHAKMLGISDEVRTQLRTTDDARAREDRLKTKKK